MCVSDVFCNWAALADCLKNAAAPDARVMVRAWSWCVALPAILTPTASAHCSCDQLTFALATTQRTSAALAWPAGVAGCGSGVAVCGGGLGVGVMRE